MLYNIGKNTMKVQDIDNNIVETNEYKYFVTMSDSFLSGWGPATGKTHKQIYMCKDKAQAIKLIDRIESKRDKAGMRYINLCIHAPYYNPKRYTTTYRICTENDFNY